ncbi:MAG: ABC transporter ATP-binding protein [Promethearchaeota archaeon]
MSKAMNKAAGSKWNIYADNEQDEEKRKYRLFGKDFMQIYGYMDPYKKRFYGTILLSIVQALIFLILPVLAGYALDIVDKVIVDKANVNDLGEFVQNILDKVYSKDFIAEIAEAAFLSLLGVIFLVLFSVLAMAFIMRVRIWQNNKIGINIIYDLRNDVYKSLQKQTFNFYDKQVVGDLVARATSDVNLLKTTLSEQLAFFIRQILQFSLALVVMLIINWSLTLYSLSVMPVLFLIMYYYRKRMHPLFLSSRKSYGKLTSKVEENVAGVRVVRSFGQVDQEINKFSEKNEDYFKKTMKIAKLQSWFDPIIGLLNGTGLIFVIFIGGFLFVNGQMTLGNMFQFVILMNFSLGPLRFIGVFLGNLSQINAAAKRIVEILNSKPEIKVDENPVIKELKGEIEFKNVSFKYPGSKKLVLKNITLKVSPGETVAILGSTGSGKTTLVNLIPRLYDLPDDDENGEILIDDINIKKYDLHSLRSQISIVAQETFLFARSIKRNIALAADEGTISMEEIIKAAKIACIHDFIVSLPEGYDTEVGERGVTLSGGQKQRIALARALVTRPRILILDDATSSVDVDTEYEIQRAFKDFLGEGTCTTFIISQRLSTVRLADRIMVLENGKIIEIGTHDDLIKKKGIYYKIYSTLSREGYAK